MFFWNVFKNLHKKHIWKNSTQKVFSSPFSLKMEGKKVFQQNFSNGSDGLAASLASFLVELFSLNEIGDEVAFYIATPPQQQEVIKETTAKTIKLVKQQIGHHIPVSGKVYQQTYS